MRLLRPQHPKPLVDATDATDGRLAGASEQGEPEDKTRAAPADSSPRTIDPQDKHLLLRQTSLLRAITEFIDQPNLNASLAALAGELHSRFPSDRVVIGLLRKDRVRIVAISQQAQIDQKSQEVEQLRRAISEACDQDAQIHYAHERGNDNRALTIIEAHRALAAGRAGAEVLTTPMSHQGTFVGAILIERTAKQPWASLTTELMRQIADVIAPMVALRDDGEKGLAAKFSESVQQVLPALARPRRVLQKLLFFALVAVLVAAYFVSSTHRVAGHAEVVATERRMVTAPMAGYIKSVGVKAGDLVQAGTLLLALDSKDLELERAKSQNALDSAEAEFRSAMASHDRNKMAIVQASMKQAQAELALIQTQLNRARITSPTDGLVAKGDLTQSLGAPVERGEVLFEITPRSGHEVHLLVDEADIAYVKQGQTGKLVLKANPNSVMEFSVSAIHPIAQPGEGANRFRVEALLHDSPADFRPGQTGVGKVEVGEARLLWIWTHRFVEWCEQKVWEWLG